MKQSIRLCLSFSSSIPFVGECVCAYALVDALAFACVSVVAEDVRHEATKTHNGFDTILVIGLVPPMSINLES